MPDSSFAREYGAVLDGEGYVVIRRMVDAERCAELCELASQELAVRRPPLEFEVDVGYPGASHSRDAPGGETIRLLLAVWCDIQRSPPGQPQRPPEHCWKHIFVDRPDCLSLTITA